MKVRNKHGVPHWSAVFGAIPVGEFEMDDALAAKAVAGGLVEAAVSPTPVEKAPVKPQAQWKATPPKDEEK